jgi:hypothetical protein
MLEHVIGNDAAFLTQVLRGSGEVNGVPVDDCADDEIEAGRPKRLAFKRTITNFTTLVKKDSPLEFVGSLTRVQSRLTTPL